MLIVYLLTSMLSAALLFLVQPMIGKVLLPVLGGGPSVWNMCMVFFQAGLLAGYLYSHFLALRLRPAVQVGLHCMILALPLLVLPIGLHASGAVPDSGSPVPWLLGALLTSVGLPFFVLSTTGPLLQHWLASTRGLHAKDPYFLYAASNVGSLGGLLAFPVLFEPLLRATTPGASLTPPHLLPLSQSTLWSIGYVLFALLMAICGVSLIMRRASDPIAASPIDVDVSPQASITLVRRLRWLLLAFAPSSLLLGATMHLTTNVAAIPLFWVVPLALYLLTFIIAFSPRAKGPARWTSAALAIFALAASMSLWGEGLVPMWINFPIHILTVFVAGLVCHGRLAADRPAPDKLTEFYLFVALGGVLGGVFNALVAPLLFDFVAEYPIALVLVCLLRPDWDSEPAAHRTAVSTVLDIAVPAAIIVLTVGTSRLVSGLARVNPDAPLIMTIAIPAFICLGLVAWRVRFALGLAALLAIAAYRTNTISSALLRERTFFGVSRVIRDRSPAVQVSNPQGETHLVATTFNLLLHGATKHGSQNLDPEMKDIATAYFHRSGPMGQIFTTFQPLGRLDRVGVIGLGAGTLATYGRPGDRFTYYEIDPAVVRIARDSGFFTFLTDSKAQLNYVLGDGRRSLTRAEDGEYGMIVMDAFSSDSVPVHLLTREAVEMYFRKLRPDGLLVINISNVTLVLDDVVFAIASDLGYPAVCRLDNTITAEQVLEGKDPSMWAVMARNREALGPLADDPGWSHKPSGRPTWGGTHHLWTDDFSNVIGVLSVK